MNLLLILLGAKPTAADYAKIAAEIDGLGGGRFVYLYVGGEE